MVQNLHKITLNAPTAVIDPMRQKNRKNGWESKIIIIIMKNKTVISMTRHHWDMKFD